MIVMQCDSCKKETSTTNGLARPAGWMKVALRYISLDSEYDLCPECAAKPMTFGELSVTFQDAKAPF